MVGGDIGEHDSAGSSNGGMIIDTGIGMGTVDIEPDFKPPEGDAKQALREQLRKSLSKREVGLGVFYAIRRHLTMFMVILPIPKIPLNDINQRENPQK